MPDILLSMSLLDHLDLTCSLIIMLVMEGARKEKKGLDFFLSFNLVYLLKLLVATAYIDCKACAPL